MKRRGFLAGLLGLAAAPALAMLPKVAPTIANAAPSIFSGELGSYNGIRIVAPSQTVHSLREAARRELADWFAKRTDAAVFAGLTGARELESPENRTWA